MDDIFDKIAEELKSIRTHINKKRRDFSFKRDFENLSYNARKIYNAKYSKKEECANILYKLCSFFEVFFDKKANLSNSLPISIPNKDYSSDKEKEETEVEFNVNVLLFASFRWLDGSGLIKCEIEEEEKFKMKKQILLNDFLEDFKNNEFKFETNMVLKHFANLIKTY
jgi:hypothetical protein